MTHTDKSSRAGLFPRALPSQAHAEVARIPFDPGWAGCCSRRTRPSRRVSRRLVQQVIPADILPTRPLFSHPHCEFTSAMYDAVANGHWEREFANMGRLLSLRDNRNRPSTTSHRSWTHHRPRSTPCAPP
ncbi:hypothetical protein B0T18DRAFT_94632 [Schizothecium vesticola]|uniref:Uncharacterized protein n=1 Tax=Schizothecium vesticola TaxID=314040 RepID=A0AA40KB34_9PEZI|nr:hypothetical protein B0T18DRAFT_94632 [Schizothecium vesticola]